MKVLHCRDDSYNCCRWTEHCGQYFCQGIVSFNKTAIKVSTSLSHQVRLIAANFKVVGKTQAMKSNLQNFRYRCLVVALIDVSEVLLTLHACMNYEIKKNLKIVSSSKYN